MKHWIIILALSCCAVAQTQGNLPTAFQSVTADASAIGGVHVNDQVDFLNVQAGDVLWMCQSRGFNSSFSEVLTLTDTMSCTWNYSTFISGTDPLGTKYGVQAAWCIAPSTGSESVLFNGVATGVFNESGTDFRGNFVADGGFNSTSVTGSAPFPSNISVNTTTSVNGDLVAGCAGSNIAGRIAMSSSSGPTPQFAVYDGEATGNWSTFVNAGTAGTYNITYNQNIAQTGSNPAAALVEFTQAFSPVAIGIADTLLPDGAQSQAYSATIHPFGGTGTYACTLQSGSLPSGLSLGGSGNCVISGTIGGPTGTYSITIRATESGGGTHADSSGLSIKVGAALGTPAIVQQKIAAGGFSGALTFTSNINSGNAILVLLDGFGRHSGPAEGYILPIDGVGGSLTDTRGTLFTRAVPVANGTSRPMLAYLGCATSSGADTVTFTKFQSRGAAISMFMFELSNTQPVLDYGVLSATAGSASSPYTLTSPTLTVPVGGESLFSMMSAFEGTMAPVAPFTDIGTSNTGFELVDAAQNFGVSSGATTATTTATTSFPKDELNGMYLLALRPEIAGLACGGTPITPPSVPRKKGWVF